MFISPSLGNKDIYILFYFIIVFWKIVHFYSIHTSILLNFYHCCIVKHSFSLMKCQLFTCKCKLVYVIYNFLHCVCNIKVFSVFICYVTNHSHSNIYMLIFVFFFANIMYNFFNFKWKSMETFFSLCLIQLIIYVISICHLPLFFGGGGRVSMLVPLQ